MATHAALLRGINVGGRNKIPMADLRATVSSLGYAEVSTYIQSGNVLFSTPETDAAVLEAALGDVIASSFSLKIEIVVVTRDQLARVLSQNPYPGEPNPKYVHVVFPGTEPDRALLDRTLYLHTPDGYGTSEQSQAVLRISTPVSGTARNLATTAELLAMCDGVA